MQKGWQWISGAIGSLVLLSLGVQAFSTPWVWSPLQLVVAGYLSFLALIAGWWLSVWFRGGSQGVWEEWKYRKQQLPAQRPTGVFSPKTMAANLLFWIVVAIVLVIAFNLGQG